MMNNDLSRTPPEQDNAGKKRRFLQKIWKTLAHNWAWKLMSLVLAICLWGALISQDTSLPREKTIEGVRVSVTNSASPRSLGLIVVDGLDELETVALRVSVPQRNYTQASSANYSARLDLSQIQNTGVQTIKVTASSSNASQYGTVKEVISPEVTVRVEELGVLYGIPVEARWEGQMNEDYFAGALLKSADAVDISGPKSVVDKVSRCVVVYDLSTLSPERSPNSFSLPFIFEDAEGNTLDSSHLTVTPRGQTGSISRITLTQDVYYLAKVAVASDALIKGEPAEGYAVSSVRVTPSTVIIAGSQVAVAPYLGENAFLYPFDQVDITGQSRNVSQLLYLNTPGSVEYISNNTVQVVVTILPEAFVNTEAATEQNP